MPRPNLDFAPFIRPIFQDSFEMHKHFPATTHLTLGFLSVLELAIVAPNFHGVTIHLFDIGINALRHTMHQ